MDRSKLDECFKIFGSWKHRVCELSLQMVCEYHRQTQAWRQKLCSGCARVHKSMSFRTWKTTVLGKPWQKQKQQKSTFGAWSVCKTDTCVLGFIVLVCVDPREFLQICEAVTNLEIGSCVNEELLFEHHLVSGGRTSTASHSQLYNGEGKRQTEQWTLILHCFIDRRVSATRLSSKWFSCWCCLPVLHIHSLAVFFSICFCFGFRKSAKTFWTFVALAKGTCSQPWKLSEQHNFHYKKSPTGFSARGIPANRGVGAITMVLLCMYVCGLLGHRGGNGLCLLSILANVTVHKTKLVLLPSGNKANDCPPPTPGHKMNSWFELWSLVFMVRLQGLWLCRCRSNLCCTARGQRHSHGRHGIGWSRQ